MAENCWSACKVTITLGHFAEKLQECVLNDANFSPLWGKLQSFWASFMKNCWRACKVTIILGHFAECILDDANFGPFIWKIVRVCTWSQANLMRNWESVYEKLARYHKLLKRILPGDLCVLLVRLIHNQSQIYTDRGPNVSECLWNRPRLPIGMARFIDLRARCMHVGAKIDPVYQWPNQPNGQI